MANPISGALNADKFWLLLNGEIVIVRDRHVVDVVTNPEKFGTTREELEDKYGDIQTSIQSREEIIEDFTKRGHTRIRKVKGKQGSFWTVQVGTGGGRKIPRTIKNNIVNWAMGMIATSPKFAKEDVMVFNEKAELLFGGNSYSSRKTLENLVLDDTGVFEACVLVEPVVEKKLPNTIASPLIVEANRYMNEVSNPVSVDPKFLRESSWSRILQHIESTPTFAIISAYRGEDPIANSQSHTQLKKDVKSLGYGYIDQDSGYSYKNPKNNDEEEMKEEESLFIPNMSLKDAMALGKKYDQESILWKDNERGFVLMYTTGDRVGEIDMNFQNKIGGKNITFNPDVLKIAYSALKRANKTQKNVKFAYKGKFDDKPNVSENEYTLTSLKEAVIPSRTEAMKSGYKNNKIVALSWKRLV